MSLKTLKLRYYHYHQNLQKASHISLLFLSLLVLFYCREISGYFANYNADYWFSYFIIVERLSMLLLLLSSYNYLKKKCWVILELLLCFLAQDFIDRVIFNIKEWNLNDTVGIGLIGLLIVIRIIKKR